MITNLDFFVTDADGREYQVICEVDCSGQAPDYKCTDSDVDYYGWFDVDEVTYESVNTSDDDGEAVEVGFDACSADLQEKIENKIEELAEYEYKNQKEVY